MINPYDLGKNNLADSCQKIRIDDLVRMLKKDLKAKIITTQIEALGFKIKLGTSKTRFNGERLWFLCPTCNRRVGTIYQHPISAIIGCRICLGLNYKKQRYKGMTELKI